MSTSDELPFEWLDQAIAPNVARCNPAFWIKDLVLLSSLKHPSPQVIRRFQLRRGLNILWAKPFKPEAAGPNTGEAFAGHAAGKTLFCRMIRYLLGERHLGNETVQGRMASAFPDGWAVGTILIESTPWLVGRPFASKHGQFAVQGKTVDDLFGGEVFEHQHYDTFQDALHRRVTRDHRLHEFPDQKGRIDFQHLLPWLTRDQEARYSSAAGWRETSSGAEPMATDNEERHFLMRVMLDLIDPEEKPELDKNARLVREQVSLRNRTPVLKDRAKTDFDRLRQGMKSAGLAPDFVEQLSLESDLLTSSVEEKLADELRRLNGLIEEIPSAADVGKLQSALTRATELRFGLERDVADLNKQVDDKKVDWGNFENRRSGEQLKDHQRSLPMPTGYCGAPIDVAKQHGCGLWKEFSDFPNPGDDETTDLAAMSARFAAEVNSLEKQRDDKTLAVKEARKVEVSAASALAAANDKRHQLFAFLREKKVTFEGLRTLADRAREAHVASQQGEIDQKDIEKKLRESYEIQQSIRTRQDDVRHAFQSYFEAVCRHVLGRDVTATVTIERRNLVLETFDRGPLTSAAIETVKILALDLAALWSTIEGRGTHPGFLIHDGPREADMDAWMYRRFFTFVRKLEEAYPSGEEPAFQYIITTTEAPPDDMQCSPWLLQPPLSAQTPDQRLLKSDLR